MWLGDVQGEFIAVRARILVKDLNSEVQGLGLVYWVDCFFCLILDRRRDFILEE